MQHDRFCHAREPAATGHLAGHELQNVSRACHEFRISRATYYKWLDRWLRYGPGGLEPHAKRQPQMPNQVSPVVEQAILDYICVWPTLARAGSHSSWPSRAGAGSWSRIGVSTRPCAASSYTFCWLTTRNDMQQAATFGELVATHYRDLRVILQRALTDNGPEYVGKDFRDRLAALGIEHTRIKPGRPATNGHVERFRGTVLHEFYRLACRRRYYRSLAELQGASPASSAGTTTAARIPAPDCAARLRPRSSPTQPTGVRQHDEEFLGGAPSVNTSRWLDSLVWRRWQARGGKWQGGWQLTQDRIHGAACRSRGAANS